MRLMVLLAALVATMLICAIDVTAAQGPTRVFVAAQGSDANPCTFAQPCRTFQHAHDVVVAKGEIDVLDPAGYGTLTITKAISIQGHEFSGMTVGSGGTGIIINAAVDDAVNLRGLLIDGAGIGTRGIQFNSGKSLLVQNCVIRNLTAEGIRFASTTTLTSLAVSDTLVADNGGSGILVRPSGTTVLVSAVFNRVEVHNNTFSGISVDGNASDGSIKTSVFDSVVARNADRGLYVQSNLNQAENALFVFRSLIHSNNFGLTASGVAAFITMGQSFVTANNTDWSKVSATLYSYGDNSFEFNNNNLAPQTPYVDKK